MLRLAALAILVSVLIMVREIRPEVRTDPSVADWTSGPAGAVLPEVPRFEPRQGPTAERAARPKPPTAQPSEPGPCDTDPRGLRTPHKNGPPGL